MSQRRSRGAEAACSGAMYASFALEPSFARRLDASRGLRHAEIDDPRDAVDPDQDVVRRDVAVDDVQRTAVIVPGLVRGVQAVECTRDDAERDGQGHAPVRVSFLTVAPLRAGELPQ